MSFFQFKEQKFWNYETSPFIELQSHNSIQLCPNEWYLFCIDFEIEGYDPDLDVKILEVFTCDGGKINIEYCLKTVNNVQYFEFKILDDYYCDILYLSINDRYYSNPFTCTEENKCYTSLVHYKDPIDDCYCEGLEPLFKSTRLKIALKDCEDADEFEQYFEFTTGRTRSSRAKQKTFAVWHFEGDKLTHDCFKSAYNSAQFFLNRKRQSKIEPFSRGSRLGDTNCIVSEFKTDPYEDYFEQEKQLACFSVFAGVDQCVLLPKSTTTLNGEISNPNGLTLTYNWVQISGASTTISDPTILNPNVTGLLEGAYIFELSATDDFGLTQSDTVVINVKSISNGIPIQIALRDCEGITIGNLETVYVADTNLQNGDIIYTDIALTIPYNGMDQQYGFYINSMFQNFVFDLSTIGVVSNITNCVNTNVDATIINEFEDMCGICSLIEVEVPAGETRTVVIQKVGLANYTTLPACVGADTNVFADLTETINATKTYQIGINAANGVGASTSIILVVVGSNIVSISKNHNVIVSTC